jgi:hypothetical protein
MQQIVAQLLAQLQASEQDKFAAHLYQSRRQHRRACERPDKATRLSSARLSQATKSRRAWASPATFAPGNTCCGFTSETQVVRRNAASRPPPLVSRRSLDGPSIGRTPAVQREVRP